MIKGIILISSLIFSSMSYASEDINEKYIVFNGAISFCSSLSAAANIAAKSFYEQKNLDHLREVIENQHSNPKVKKIYLGIFHRAELLPKNVDVETQTILIEWFKNIILKDCIATIKDAV